MMRRTRERKNEVWEVPKDPAANKETSHPLYANKQQQTKNVYTSNH